jgi:anaerobic magnesium-protoporphyrin IX monomethyl ester cyclase
MPLMPARCFQLYPCRAFQASVLEETRRNMMVDCLIVGYNDMKFENYVKILKSMGTEHTDYRDLNLNFIEYDNKPYRAADILTHFYFQDRKKDKPFHNADVLWMAITYLGTYLTRRGCTFDYVNLFQLEKDRFKEKLEKNKYLTIAITSTIYNFDQPILEVISFIKRYNTTAKIIVGGPYISKRSERMEMKELQSLYKYMGADFYVFSREGEEALVQIIKSLKSNGDFSSINNIAYKGDKEFIVTPVLPELNSLEENMIDYSLFPREDIGGYVNLRVSKGCPYSCAFCGFPLRSRKYIYTDVQYIKKELDAIRNVGTVTHLHFTDDTFNVPKKRFKEILRMMIKEKYNFKWNCYFRGDHVDEETAELMKESGCHGVFLGLESANNTVLKNMNKKAGKEFYRQSIPLFKKAGIATFASIFIGFPGETVETFRETINFLKETEPDFYRPQLWYCDPLTPIWQQREKFGLTGSHFNWSHSTMDAQTACDLQEEALMSVDTPIWVPDPGFNYITLYLLDQRGMSIEKQKTFLKCFNAVVKEKLLYPGKKEISPPLLESLRKSCRFDEPAAPDMEPVEVLCGSGYLAAEKFWAEEFGSGSPPAKMRKVHDISQTGDGKGLSTPVIIEEFILDRLRSVYDADIPVIILAAYSVLLLRLRGYEDTAIVTAIDEKEVFPLRLYPLWDLSFKEFVRETRQKLRQSAEHRLYALYILTRVLQTAQYNSPYPAFDTACWVSKPGGEGIKPEEQLQFYPPVYHGIDLILEVIADKSKVTLQFRYSTARYKEETIEKYKRYLKSIFESVSEVRDILLKEIVLEPGAEKRQSAVEAHAGKAFNF